VTIVNHPASPFASQGIFKEARTRRRRRHVMVGVLVIALGLGVAGLIASNELHGSQLLPNTTVRGRSVPGALVNGRHSKASTCPNATQPPGGYPKPAPASPPDPATTLANWGTAIIPIDHLGNYDWTSNAVAVSTVPSGFGFSSVVIGGQAVMSSPVSIQPEAVGPSSSTGTPTVVRVTFSVSCMSGKPALDLASLIASK